MSSFLFSTKRKRKKKSNFLAVAGRGLLCLVGTLQVTVKGGRIEKKAETFFSRVIHLDSRW